jgi:hypothetical protein
MRGGAMMDEAKQAKRQDPGRRSTGQDEDRDPGRRFGYEIAFDSRFEGRRWPDVEPELRLEYDGWLKRHGYVQADDLSWERVMGRVREAWESVLEVEHTQVDPRTGQWDERASEYRRLWEEHYSASGDRWEDVEPGYRYAHEMALDPRYQGRSWGDMAPVLEAGLPAWAAAHGYQVRDGESIWERMRKNIQHVWERAVHHTR